MQFIAEWADAWDDWEMSPRITSTPGSASSSSSTSGGVRRPRGFRSRCASLKCGRSGTDRGSGCSCSRAWRKPSKPWGCRSKTLTPTPDLRDTARAMSQENVEIVRRAAEVFSTDLDLYVSEFLAPEVEWHTAAEAPTPLRTAGGGVQGLRRAMDGQLRRAACRVEEFIDVGDDRVWTWVRWSGRGHTSGVESEWHLAVIYTLRHGRVVRAHEYFDRAEALRSRRAVRARRSRRRVHRDH